MSGVDMILMPALQVLLIQRLITHWMVVTGLVLEYTHVCICIYLLIIPIVTCVYIYIYTHVYE